jgi:hypothetical protein
LVCRHGDARVETSVSAGCEYQGRTDMPEQPMKPTEIADDARLPVPRHDRRPMPRPDNTVARSFAVGPVLAASLFGAAAAATMAGAAVAARILWPWTTSTLREVAKPAERSTSLTDWFGPGVHVSYTHVEIHWPGGPRGS